MGWHSHKFQFRENRVRTIAPPSTKVKEAFCGEPGTVPAFVESEHKQLFLKKINRKLGTES